MKIRWKTAAHFCFLDFFFWSHFVWEVISTIPQIRHRVSSLGETPRSSSKILRCASYQFNYLLGVSSRDEAQRLMLDIYVTSKSRNFPGVCMVDHINVCKFSHLCGAELYLNLAVLLILRRSFQWCWHGFSLTGPCQKLKKPWKGLLAGKWKGISQIQKYIPCQS